MRKLRPAEIRMLMAFPKSIIFGDGFVLRPSITSNQWPINTPYTTVYNLYKFGLVDYIIHRWYGPVHLTAKGEELRNNINKGGNKK